MKSATKFLRSIDTGVGLSLSGHMKLINQYDIVSPLCQENEATPGPHTC